MIGKVEEHGKCYSVLALLLAFATPSRKRKGDEAPSEKLRRLSSPRHWDVALVPFPEEFVPLPTSTETGLACPAPADERRAVGGLLAQMQI